MKIALLLAVFVAGLSYIRLAPTNAHKWRIERMPTDPGEYPGMGRYLVNVPLSGDSQTQFNALKHIALGTPRTRVIAEFPATREIILETRSLVLGFPDYTTLQLIPANEARDATLRVLGRLRFGKHDLGVNQARIQTWLASLDFSATPG